MKKRNGGEVWLCMRVTWTLTHVARGNWPQENGDRKSVIIAAELFSQINFIKFNILRLSYFFKVAYHVTIQI